MDQIQEEWERGASGSSVVGLIHPPSLLESFWLSRRWSPPPHMVKTTTPLSGHLDWHWKRNGIIKKKKYPKGSYSEKNKENREQWNSLLVVYSWVQHLSAGHKGKFGSQLGLKAACISWLLCWARPCVSGPKTNALFLLRKWLLPLPTATLQSAISLTISSTRCHGTSTQVRQTNQSHITETANFACIIRFFLKRCGCCFDEWFISYPSSTIAVWTPWNVECIVKSSPRSEF